MNRIMCSSRVALGAAAIALVCASPASPQQVAVIPPTAAYRPLPHAIVAPTGAESVTVAAGSDYQARWLHRWFFGDTYRDLWATPFRVPVLDFRTYAGGLHPTKVGGGMET